MRNEDDLQLVGACSEAIVKKLQSWGFSLDHSFSDLYVPSRA